VHAQVLREMGARIRRDGFPAGAGKSKCVARTPIPVARRVSAGNQLAWDAGGPTHKGLVCSHAKAHTPLLSVNLTFCHASTPDSTSSPP
jgi:hypothetical protein